MKICIPVPPRHEGGMYTFLENLRNWLDAHKIEHTQDVAEAYDILFVNSWVVPYDLIEQAKSRHANVRVVQRVDGSAIDYGRYDDADMRQARVNLLADQTIFQSAYSRYATRAKYKLIQQDGPVIFNPVDLARFHPPLQPRKLPAKAIRIANVSFSTNRMKGTWQIGQLAAEHPDVEFHLCGRYPSLPAHENIIQHGHLDRAQLAQVLQDSHCFIHLAENDPCPNVVVEALASGLPVLYRDSGGTPELVGDCGVAMTVDTFGAALSEVLAGYSDLGERARQRAEQQFSPNVIFPRYLAAMEQSVRHPLPTLGTIMDAARRGYLVVPAHPVLLYHRVRRRFTHSA